jgi:hypothetical protein
MAALTALILFFGLSNAEAAHRPARFPITEIGKYSSQVSPRQAVAGAQISVHERTTGAGGSHPPASRPPASGSSSAPLPDYAVLPSLPSDSRLLKYHHPAGAGSLWYRPSPGQACVYIPHSTGICYALVAPGRRPPDVSATASELADQLGLSLAGIDASPSAKVDGLAGEPSWFWLARAPGEEQRSITLAGETVTVTADPSQITWGFGDGGSVVGGPGVSYAVGAPPSDAITHVYETRCLPGDQGRDPYVLAGCASDGYHVLASTTWTISYAASGPISQSGQLPARSTESELVYPVSEVRAFLAGGST